MRSLQLDSLAPGLRVEITGRLKSAHSTHLKMRRKNIDFGQVCDARALRIVIGELGEAPGTKDEVEACYAVVNAIHKLYRPVPGEYDDYVANKKRSGYQSLHTAVTGPDGALLEFQVRTRAMHEAAEFGDAAHWLYKDFINAVKRRPDTTPAIGGDGASGGGPEDVDVVAAGVARARASPTAETNVDRSAVGQPVQIVWDVGVSGGGRPAQRRGGVLRGGVQNPRRRTEARRRPGARRRVHGSGGDGGVGRHGAAQGRAGSSGSREPRGAEAKRTGIPRPGVCALLRRPLAQGGRLRPQAGDDGGVAGRGGARDGAESGARRGGGGGVDGLRRGRRGM